MKSKPSTSTVDYSWLTTDQVLNLAFSGKQVADLAPEAALSFVRELAIRLQRATSELEVLAR